MRRHYKKHSSGFKQWDQLLHAEEYLIFPDNIGPHLSIDEVSLSMGELYTFVTNKEGKGKQKTLVACINGTRSEDIIQVLEKIPLEKRLTVKEVTLDMAKNMEAAAKTAFPNSSLVTDRFHVVRLTIEALQQIRIKLRWEELDKENKAIEQAKLNKVKYEPEILENGDTPKQLLARSRYIIFKAPHQWTKTQEIRARLLFTNFPILQTAYYHVLHFRKIYATSTKTIAKQRMEEWAQESLNGTIKEFYTPASTILNNLKNILNFFDNRSTNASAESFNSKIKLFRANLRGVIDISFFLFRLNKLFA